MADRSEEYRQIGLNVAHYRKLKNLTQEELAEKVPMSRGHLSRIEAPNVTTYFSIAVLMNIADALGIEVYKLLRFEDI